MYEPTELERCVDGLLTYMRNVVPGIICSASVACDPATNYCIHSTVRKLSVLYCQRAILARDLEETIRTAAVARDYATCRTALRTARDRLAPMLSDDLSSQEANASSRVGRNLVKLVNGTLQYLSDRTGETYV
jgi:hypothetical protein